MWAGYVVANRFRIEQPAGRGGMGAVYRALDQDTGKPVALKVLVGKGEELTKRFNREIQLLSQLKHPAIVRYVAQGVTPDRDWFLATEWLEGERLTDRLKRGPLSVAEALALGLRVTDALSEAHGRNIIHRDITPTNLFLVGGSCAEARILDFGVARVAGEGQSLLTAMGATLGTPGYMAPEQAGGEGTIDTRADVFACGCVLFRCLTGEFVWEGDSPMSLLFLMVTDPARRARELRPEVPIELDEFIDRTLQKRPDDRPRDAGELWATLQPIAAAHGVYAVQGAPPKLPYAPPSAPSTPRAPPPPRAEPTGDPRTVPRLHATAAPPTAPPAPEPPLASAAPPLPAAPTAQLPAGARPGPMLLPQSLVDLEPPRPSNTSAALTLSLIVVLVLAGLAGAIVLFHLSTP